MTTNNPDDTLPNQVAGPSFPKEGETVPIVPSQEPGATKPIPISVTPESIQSQNQPDFTLPMTNVNLSPQTRLDNNRIFTPPLIPTPAAGGKPPLPPGTARLKKPRKNRRWIWVLLGIFCVILFGVLGSYAGYATAIQQRLEKQNKQIVITAMEQFQLGLQDQAAGNMEMARRRFEYVIQLDPGFPGAPNKLMEVMLQIATVSVPTAVPTQRITPTPDTRGKEGMFASAQGYLRNGQWNDAIQSLEWLRKEDKNFHPVEVDGLLYVALRNRGIEKILTAKLEAGTYDLALAERFAPLDREAEGYRNAVRTYMIGSSFWLLDWVQAIQYLGQVSSMALVDGSGVSVAERYRFALKSYGDQLAVAGDACGAEQQYVAAYQAGLTTGIGQKGTEVAIICHPPTPIPEPILPTDTPGPPEPTAAPTTDYPAICCPPPDPANVDCVNWIAAGGACP
jgi:hypothetical protein